jgi:peroxiredoxin
MHVGLLVDRSRRRHLARCAGLAASGLLATWLAGCAREPLQPRFDYVALDGQRRSSDGLRGQVVLVSFWATTCAVCVTEMPRLVALHRRYAGPRFRTLAVAMAHDPPARVAHFAETRQLPFDVVIDNTGGVAAAFGRVTVTPTTALLDRDGRLAFITEGKPDDAELASRIERLLQTA